MDNNQGSGGAFGSGGYQGKTPDDLITHGKQIFQALGKLDQTERRRVVDEWRGDPATRNVFSELMEPATG